MTNLTDRHKEAKLLAISTVLQDVVQAVADNIIAKWENKPSPIDMRVFPGRILAALEKLEVEQFEEYQIAQGENDERSHPF